MKTIVFANSFVQFNGKNALHYARHMSQFSKFLSIPNMFPLINFFTVAEII
jgi:hypothetical protein